TKRSKALVTKKSSRSTPAHSNIAHVKKQNSHLSKPAKLSMTRVNASAPSSVQFLPVSPATKPSNSFGVHSPKLVRTPPAASPKFPTTSPMSTAPCAGASAGNSAPSKSWTLSASKISPPSSKKKIAPSPLSSKKFSPLAAKVSTNRKRE